jgi:hypothetical protein
VKEIQTPPPAGVRRFRHPDVSAADWNVRAAQECRGGQVALGRERPGIAGVRSGSWRVRGVGQSASSWSWTQLRTSTTAATRRSHRPFAPTPPQRLVLVAP